MWLLFDLDDTLVPSSRAYDHGLRAVGLRPDDADYLKARADVKRLCPPGYPGARSRRLYFKRMLQNLGTYTPRSHLHMIEVYETSVCNYLAQAWRKLGRPELFTRLRSMSTGIGVVTNESSAFQSAKLQALDPDWRFFDFVVASEDVGREKPAREIFERAFALAGTEASSCFFIGDNDAHDIQGSAKLGMKSVRTTEFTDPTAASSKTSIARLDELPAVLSSRPDF